MKKKKSLIIWSSIFIFILILTREMYCFVLYLFNVSLGRSDKSFLAKYAHLDEEAKVLYEDTKKEENDILNWLNNTFIKYYNIASYDGLILYGTAFIQKEYTHNWIIVIHGYGGSGELMYYAAKRFFEKGYNVVVPDCRGHGKSQGDYVGMGWYDRIDILAWAEKIINGDSECKIALYGVSMGGAAVLMAAGEDLPENIKCIIEDCGYTSVKDILKYQLKNTFHLPVFPILNIVDFICRIRIGFRLKTASAIEKIKQCKVPVLFLHGGKDDLVPLNMMCRMYKEADCPKDMYIVREAGHGISAMVEKENYWNKIFKFLGKYY